MIRRLFQLVISALLGITTTVAGAWLCAWRVAPIAWTWRLSSSNTQFTLCVDEDRVLHMLSWCGAAHVYARGYYIDPHSSSKLKPSSPRALPWWWDGERTEHAFVIAEQRRMTRGDILFHGEFATGWPMLCLRSDIAIAQDWRGAIGPYPVPITPIEWQAPANVLIDSCKVYLPNEVLWRGMLINTVVYSSAWFILLLVPGALRRLRRRRAGRCVRCGYDLRGGGDICPECGRSAHRAKKMAAEPSLPQRSP